MKTLLATALVAASLVSGAHAQDRTIVRRSRTRRATPRAQGTEKFADLVEAKSGGKLKVNLFPGGTLGSDQANRLGPAGRHGGDGDDELGHPVEPGQGIRDLGLPLHVGNSKEADAVTDGPFGQKLLRQARKPRAWWAWPTRSWASATITNSKRPDHQGSKTWQASSSA